MNKNSSDLLKIVEQLERKNRDTIDFLTNKMLTTNDQYLRDKIGFLLTDCFKSEDIADSLVKLIKDKRWQNRNGTLLFLLSECTCNPKYLYFLVDLLLKEENKDNGEIFMDGYSMIIDLHPPLDRKEITKSLQRIRREEKKVTNDKERKQLLQSLTNYLLGQREITKFYDRFIKKD